MQTLPFSLVRSLFASVHDVELVKQHMHDSQTDLTGEMRVKTPTSTRTASVTSPHPHSHSETLKIDKRLTQIHVRITFLLYNVKVGIALSCSIYMYKQAFSGIKTT